MQMSKVINKIFNVFDIQNLSPYFYLYHKCNFYKSSVKFKPLDPKWGSAKHLDKRKIQSGIQYEILRTDEENANIEQQIEILHNKIEEQGTVVRELKSSGSSSITLENEVKLLKGYKRELEKLSSKFPAEFSLDKARMLDHVKRKFIFDVAFSSYDGLAGQYDYGPVGCQMVDNILMEWNKHFVVRDRMMKVNCSIITPENVLKASGHVDRFSDYVVKDKSGETFRLDHLIKKHIEHLLATRELTSEQREKMSKDMALLDGMNLDDLRALIQKYEVKFPDTEEDLGEPFAFNLMFPVTLGSAGSVKGYLRPEHAQGIILNFKKLLDLHDHKLPFACAQVGMAFRNEAGTKARLLRVREFILAEIEHFCYPDDKNHPKFRQVSGTKLWLLSACNQASGEKPRFVSIGEAVTTGLVANETLGYYMARTQDFLLKIGIHPRKLRFRQHLRDECAHYAQDCWDAECLTFYGWVECVGLADRSAYDLTQHSKATGVNMGVERSLKESRMEEVLDMSMDKKRIKASWGKETGSVIEALNEMTDEEIIKMDLILSDGGEFKLRSWHISREMVPKVEKKTKEVWVERITPNVIEPSFGIGRIFYTLLEHTFRVREGEDKRTFFAVPPIVAPIKVAVLPLFRNEEVEEIVGGLADSLTEEDLSVWIDKSRKSIGRRYVKVDEMCIPFCVTIDQDTLNATPQSVALRDRDSKQQLRIPISELTEIIKKLSTGKLTWKDLEQKWPAFISQESIR